MFDLFIDIRLGASLDINNEIELFEKKNVVLDCKLQFAVSLNITFGAVRSPAGQSWLAVSARAGWRVDGWGTGFCLKRVSDTYAYVR